MALVTRNFASGDTDAPVLSGTAGAYIAVVKAMLVGTAGVAYGSGGDEKPSAGWSVLFESGNKIVLQNIGTDGGTQCCVRIVDDGSEPTYGARIARMWVYESMSDIDTGTGLASPAGGHVIRKSDTASSAARYYIAKADQVRFYMNIRIDNASAQSSGSAANCWIGGAGNAIPMVAGDPCVFSAGCLSTTSLRDMTTTGTAAATNMVLSEQFSLSRDISLTSVATPIAVMGFTASATYAALGNSTYTSLPKGVATVGYAIPAICGDADGPRALLPGVFAPMTKFSNDRQQGQVITAAPSPALATPLTAFAGGGGISGSWANGTLLIDHTGPWA